VTNCKSVLYIAVLLLAAAPLALAQGTYTQIDYPGAPDTFVTGIDGAGDIIGYYFTGSGDNGFLLSGGAYTTINYPGSQYESLYGINDLGTQIVGQTNFPTLVGFLYDISAQTFTQVNYPGTTHTAPLAINNEGTIVGETEQGASFLGFELLSSGRGTLIGTPSVTNYTLMTGISESAEVVGYHHNSNDSLTNFSFKQGKYNQIIVPIVQSAIVLGINPVGTALVGQYTPSAGVSLGFLWYRNQAVQTLQFPGSSSTIATGINRAGEVVGYFVDASNVTHGFTWTNP
jgi:probable HAF family extracellular repeat protein